METIWKVNVCKYDILQTNGQAKVTTMHYTAEIVEGEYQAIRHGRGIDDQNRVYPIPALEAVPGHVITKWCTDLLGEEMVAQIENELEADIAEQKTPTEGRFNPDYPEEIS